jgi:hypothetical protein
MKKKEKAIKIFSNLEPIKMAYTKYVLFKNGNLNLIEWFGSEEKKYLSLKYYEQKILIKLHPIIFENSFLKNLTYEQRKDFYEKNFYLSLTF